MHADNEIRNLLVHLFKEGILRLTVLLAVVGQQVLPPPVVGQDLRDQRGLIKLESLDDLPEAPLQATHAPQTTHPTARRPFRGGRHGARQKQTVTNAWQLTEDYARHRIVCAMLLH